MTSERYRQGRKLTEKNNENENERAQHSKIQSF